MDTVSTGPKAIEATVYCLNGWYKDIFERLGWMLLAKGEGRHKAEHYKMEVKDLKASIEKKLETIKDEDRKKDLLVMHKKMVWMSDLLEKVIPVVPDLEPAIPAPVATPLPVVPLVPITNSVMGGKGSRKQSAEEKKKADKKKR